MADDDAALIGTDSTSDVEETPADEQVQEEIVAEEGEAAEEEPVQETPLYAGKYKTDKELEQAYLNAQKLIGRRAEELAREPEIREEALRIAQQQAVAQQQQEQAGTEESYRLARPLAERAYKRLTDQGFEHEEAQRQAWDEALAIYNMADSLAETRSRKSMEAVEPMLDEMARPSIYGNALDAVLQQTQFPGVERQELMAALSNIPVPQWRAMSDEDRAAAVYGMAYAAIGQKVASGKFNPGKPVAPKARVVNVGVPQSSVSALSAQEESLVEQVLATTGGLTREQAIETVREFLSERGGG